MLKFLMEYEEKTTLMKSMQQEEKWLFGQWLSFLEEVK